LKPSIRTRRSAAGGRSHAPEERLDAAGERSNGHYQLPDGVVPRLMPMGRFELAALRPAARAAIGLAVLIVVAVLALVVLQGGGSPRGARAADRTGGQTSASKAAATHMGTTTHMASTLALTQTPLFKAVSGINQSMTAKGLLPPSSCKPMSTTMVSCTQPHYAINAVVFQTFPSMRALYAAYEARVKALSGGTFQANFNDCSRTSTNGEIAWNHDFQHSRKYPMSMFISGQVTDDKAAGRMYCTFNNDVLDLVWTQDDGRLMAELSGAPHFDAFQWWVGVHHAIVFPGSPAMPGMPGMSNTTK
jgi:hypothetical protein